jgi:3-oxoacyl-[acyl-carrier protein] reductase
MPSRIPHDHRPDADRGRRILYFGLTALAHTEKSFMDAGIAGKCVLVTGGSRGIGRAVVELFAAEGAEVTFVYHRDADAAREVVDAAHRAGQRVAAEQADVRDRAACAAVVERAIERWDRIDVLVNNAGIIRDSLLGLLNPEDVQDVLDTNVTGVFNVTHAVVPHMISRRAGRIINISSVSGDKGGRGQTNYAASKGAINALTRALAVELAPRKIAVNAVAPGVIETDMSQAVRDLAAEEVKSRILLRRFGSAQEVAFAVWFLASKFSDYITGQVLCVDGGFKME